MKYFAYLTLFLLLTACDSSDSKTPEQIQAEVEASQKKFAEEQARIERERKAQEEKIAMQRNFVTVRFVAVSETVLEVELSNNTDQDLDNISGALEVFDQEGNYITGTGLTLWIPGDVYLPVGGKQIATKVLDMERPESKAILLASANKLIYHFTMSRYQYLGQDEVNLVDVPSQEKTASQPVAMSEPEQPTEGKEQANPTPCGSDEFEIITASEYYPGPECEHMTRNIDSQRFLVRHIAMCRQNDDVHTAPTPVASVQLASCKKDLKQGGINYSKQICCHNWARSANGRIDD